MPFSMLPGIRILDLSRHLPGPFGTWLLADHGAEVIMIEDLQGSNPLRYPQPELGNVVPPYSVHRNKKSVLVNLKDAAGREAFLKLVATADGLLEGFRPGVMDRLGLGYAELQRLNPRLVYCSLTGYGQNGPYRSRVGHDINYMAFGGALDLTGPHDGPPVVPGVLTADLAGGMMSCIGMLMGLLQRERSGAGCYLDVSMLDCVVAMMGFYLERYTATGDLPRRGSDRLMGGAPCYNVFRTKDGRYLSLGNLEPKFWRAFCEAAGCADLVDQQFGSLQDDASLRTRMESILASRSLAEWEALLAETEVAWGSVRTLAEVFDDAHVQARGMRRDDVAPGVTQVGAPFKVRGPESTPDSAPPPRGRHTADLLREVGFSEAEIEDLAKRKAIGLAA